MHLINEHRREAPGPPPCKCMLPQGKGSPTGFVCTFCNGSLQPTEILVVSSGAKFCIVPGGGLVYTNGNQGFNFSEGLERDIGEIVRLCNALMEEKKKK